MCEVISHSAFGLESEKVGLNLNIQKMKIIASGPITSWEIDEKKVDNPHEAYIISVQLSHV